MNRTPVCARARALQAALWSYTKVTTPHGDRVFSKLLSRRVRTSYAWIMRHAPPRADVAAFFAGVEA